MSLPPGKASAAQGHKASKQRTQLEVFLLCLCLQRANFNKHATFFGCIEFGWTSGGRSLLQGARSEGGVPTHAGTGSLGGRGRAWLVGVWPLLSGAERENVGFRVRESHRHTLLCSVPAQRGLRQESSWHFSKDLSRICRRRRQLVPGRSISPNFFFPDRITGVWSINCHH